MKIGFIGIGNMGKAIIEGFLKTEVLSPDAIFVTNQTKKSRDSFAKKTGVIACAANNEVAEKSNVLFIAAKPMDIPSILQEISPSLSKDTTLVSLAAGLSLDQLASMTKEQSLPIMRIMPNLNHQVGEGMASVCANPFVSDKIFSYVRSLFDSIGETVVLPEEQFSIYSAIAGCSPAFTFTYIDALARAGVRHGLKKEIAVKIATQAVLGSAKLVSNSEYSPMDLADQVASPGGTTIEGVLTLLDEGFSSAVVKAVDASYEKDLFLLNKKNK